MGSGHGGLALSLDTVVALNDCNGIQADGRIVLDMEPVAAKWRAFGWDTLEIDGNDMDQVTAALRASRERNGRPKVVVLRTLPGKGIATLEQREKAHFMRIEAGEWDQLRCELEASND